MSRTMMATKEIFHVQTFTWLNRIDERWHRNIIIVMEKSNQLRDEPKLLLNELLPKKPGQSEQK